MTCVACPAGWIQDIKGSSTCASLNLKTVDDCKDSNVYLNNTASNPSEWDCAVCPKGGDCAGPVSWYHIGPKPGWWKIPQTNEEMDSLDKVFIDDLPVGYFAECLYPQACPGYQNNTCATDLGFRNKSRLCQACSPGYSRTTKSKCVPCDNANNHGKTIVIAFAALILFVLFVLLNTMRMRSFRSFDAERRRKSLHSTIKRIVLSHVQMLSIVLGLTVPWPSILETVLTTLSSVASFSEGVNSFECFYEGIDHSTFYYGVLVFTAIGPLVFALGIALYWFVLVRACKVLKCGTLVHSGSLCPSRVMLFSSSRDTKVSYSDADAFISSVVLLWFIALPSLLLIGSNALKCWVVGDTTFVFIDLEKECYVDDHFWYSLFVAFPMCVFYGLILPGVFMLRLRRAGSARLTDPSLMLRWGMLHSGYREETYWWELVVLIRKYFIILLVTFNNHGKFQLHISLAVLILALHLHDSHHPYGHRRDNPINSILHRYEMSSLLVLLFMLWCADFFSLELCKDDGVLCSMMVIVILLSNFGLIFYLVFMFVRAFCVRNGIEKKISLLLRATSFKSNDGGGEKGGTHKKKKKKKRKKGKKGKKEKKEKKGRTAKKARRLSSRQVLALEMARVGAQHKPEEDVIVMSLVNPMLKTKNNANLKETRKNQVRRLSKSVNPIDDGNKANELDNQILKDETSGRMYSYNNRTGESSWVGPEANEESKREKKDGNQEEKALQEETWNVPVITLDEVTGRRYTYNQTTGISSWVDSEAEVGRKREEEGVR
jgi:hypothetical protein